MTSSTHSLARAPLAAAALLTAFSCGRLDAAGRREAPPRPAAAAPAASAGDFWFRHAASQSTLSVWFGPVEDHFAVSGRRWTLVATFPGSEHPLLCLDGLLPRDGTDRLALSSESFRATLRPPEGSTWGQLTAPEELEVELEGFF